MKPPFSLLLLDADGSRVLRLSLPRWTAYAALGFAAVVAAGTIALSGEYVLVRHQSSQIAALRQRTDEQRALMDAFQTRVAAIRDEITGWKALHAKMWEAFGPDTGGSQDGTGIGGAAAEIEAPPVGVQLRPAEEVERLAAGVAEEGPRLRELETLISRTGKIVSALPLRWPIRGPVKSEFGRRRSPWTGALEQHDGIDIGSPPGTPVETPAAGMVVAANSFGDFGKHVMVDHGNGVKSLYGHLKQLDVKPGQRVDKGQIIGRVGSTGRSTGPHLHYELFVRGKPVDPRGFLWNR